MACISPCGAAAPPGASEAAASTLGAATGSAAATDSAADGAEGGLEGVTDASICCVPSAGAAGAISSGGAVLSHCFSPQSSQALQPLSLISFRDRTVSVA